MTESSRHHSMVSVVICVVTYQRPKALYRLLSSLVRLEPTGPDVSQPELMVVDNDQRESAAGIVATFAAEHPDLPVRYVVEPKRGIPFARNKAIEASAGMDLLAFIDDDDVADPSWLKHLVRAWKEHDADLVGGGYVVAYEETPPRWLTQGEFFESPGFPTGSSVQFLTTANMLIERREIDRVGLRFDENLALTGGSDALFCMQAREEGLRLVWANEATVTEWVPTTRMTLKWHVRRAFRVGTMMTLCEEKLGGFSWWKRALRFLKGAYRILKGIGLTCIGFFLVSKSRVFLGFREVARGTGTWWGLIGGRPHEYDPNDRSRSG